MMQLLLRRWHYLAILLFWAACGLGARYVIRTISPPPHDIAVLIFGGLCFVLGVSLTLTVTLVVSLRSR